ncbi:hypothetical protein ACFLQK_02355 [bacterium]
MKSPAAGALAFEVSPWRLRLRKTVYAAVTVGALIFFAQLASILGYWRTDTTAAQYKELYPAIHAIGHPGSGGL